jgi:hypothetical protein
VIRGAGAGAPRRGRAAAAAAATPHSAGTGAAQLSELRAPRSSILRGGAADGPGDADGVPASGGSVAPRRSARFSLMSTPAGHGGHGGDAAGEEEVPRAKKQHMAPARASRPASAGHTAGAGGAGALLSPAPAPRADFTAAVRGAWRPACRPATGGAVACGLRSERGPRAYPTPACSFPPAELAAPSPRRRFTVHRAARRRQTHGRARCQAPPPAEPSALLASVTWRMMTTPAMTMGI